MVCDNKERTSRWYPLASFEGKPTGSVVDDPRRAVIHSGLAERAVVGYEAPGNMIRDRPDESANDLNAQTSWAANKRLGALPGDDLGDLTALGD